MTRMKPVKVPVLTEDQVLVITMPPEAADKDIKGFAESIESWLKDQTKEQVIALHPHMTLTICKRDQLIYEKVTIKPEEVVINCPGCGSPNTLFSDNDIELGTYNEERLKCLKCKTLYRRIKGSNNKWEVKWRETTKK